MRQATILDNENDNDREALWSLNDKEAELIDAIIGKGNLMKLKYKSAWIKEGERNSKLMYSLYKNIINKALIVELRLEDE